MSDPSIHVQAAAWRALTVALATVVASRVYDHVPQKTSPPYVFMDGWQVVADKADCLDGAEVFFDVQCVSNIPGRAEAGRMAALTVAALDGLEPDLEGFSGMAFEHRTSRFIRDDDGQTTRAVVTFRALVEPD